MNTIERASAQDAARTYVQQTDAARGAAVQAAQAQASKAQHGQARRADSVTLSDNARSLANARAEVAKAPDVREQKVADIKQRVDSGTYEVSARVLARKMVDQTRNPS